MGWMWVIMGWMVGSWVVVGGHGAEKTQKTADSDRLPTTRLLDHRAQSENETSINADFETGLKLFRILLVQPSCTKSILIFSKSILMNGILNF